MSKERLEEIKSIKWENLRTSQIIHVKWLIEQAERMQELENTLRIWMDRSDHLSGEYLKYKEQNKCYREAINYVMTAESTHYNNTQNALDDIKFVINETLEEIK